MTSKFVGLILCLLAAIQVLPAAAAGLGSERTAHGLALLEEGEFREGLELLEQSYRDFPYDESLQHHLARGYYRFGLDLINSGRPGEAAEVFGRGIEFAPDSSSLRYFHAYALLREGRHVEAEGALSSAVAAHPHDAKLLELLGQLYYAGGRVAEAISAWERALKDAPDHAALQARLAQARRELEVEGGMRSSYGANFTVSFEEGDGSALGEQVLGILEQAYNEVGYDLDFFPEGQVPVLIYTRKDFFALTAAPDWSGGLYDGKIRVPLGGLSDVTPELEGLLYHEYSHAAVRRLAQGRAPRWLDEGLAEHQQRRRQERPLEALEQAVGSGSLIPLEELSGNWRSFPAEKARLAYEQSYSLVRYLLDYYGWPAVQELLRQLSSGRDPDLALRMALDGGAGTLDELELQWRTHLAGGG